MEASNIVDHPPLAEAEAVGSPGRPAPEVRLAAAVAAASEVADKVNDASHKPGSTFVIGVSKQITERSWRIECRSNTT
jgi:hypothetical protein